MVSPQRNKVLVIDDSKVIRNMVKDMLPPANFEVLEAPDGMKGLDMVKTEKPWMIMLDFLLPKMNGFEVYENIQKSQELATIPLILMSGRKQEVTDKITEPLEDHYLVFIEKPFEQKELVVAIKKALELAKKKTQVLEARVPKPMVSSQASITTAVMDPALVERIAILEEKVIVLEESNKRLKVLEQQIINQHKQIQQLVAFVKQKMS